MEFVEICFHCFKKKASKFIIDRFNHEKQLFPVNRLSQWALFESPWAGMDPSVDLAAVSVTITV